MFIFGLLVYFIVTGGELPNIKIKDICEGKFLAQQLIEVC